HFSGPTANLGPVWVNLLQLFFELNNAFYIEMLSWSQNNIAKSCGRKLLRGQMGYKQASY
ncbi:MAG TPA: hypothetical protein PKL92_08675, partial [Aquaticitalea sp.]|nr:hypothetical protein [Aquaticitalea sp.]